ncbi:uncharacterized protein EDB93DRAFT_639459 [Suillus bovinus]|uniref:uncharacterized protein n=1 Tax=Suillus bovinus TaxID=48563 RepID=UPI001B865955|nr:uncharacterized protein EDB93DRAFT_639459 [Suillus bovinus]KAG2141148.1 hypothetical protein EDB93DRAFT_639459 [Suillus bovinus]
MEYEIKPKPLFLSLAEELRIYILSFLSCRDILRCTSVCKALRQTYISSSELQYTVELSGQCLLPVSTNDHTPISERLWRLRDKAHAWFKFNAYAFRTVTPPVLYPERLKHITGEHLYSWDHQNNLVTVSTMPSKLSQRTIKHNWSPRTLCPFPLQVKQNTLMDPAQNLFAIMHVINGVTYIYLATLDGRVHPHAAEPALVLESPVYEWQAKLKCYGRHIAVWHDSCIDALRSLTTWQLHIWDWQQSTTSSSVLSSGVQGPGCIPASFCFLGNDRLLVVGEDLKLYSIEDMSRTPQLLACFLLPFPLVDLEHFFQGEHSSHPRTQAQLVYTPDPEHRLLCLTSSKFDDEPTIFFISTKIFFDIDQAEAPTPLPWDHWGPRHVRVFKYKDRSEFTVHVSGNRVLLVNEIMPMTKEYELRMMDFSPLAVTNRRGLGRVVEERSTVSVVHGGSSDGSHGYSSNWCSTIETSLPYVEVVSDRKIVGGWLQNVWMDDDRVYLLLAFGAVNGPYIGPFEPNKLEVIDI